MDVVVLGAGYAGLALVQRLETTLPDDVDITIVDERETHLVQHLIHRALRKPDLADQLEIPIETLCKRATYRQARVAGVDADDHRVHLEDGTLDFDVCAIGLGAQTAYADLPGVAEHATPFKRLHHVATVRERFQAVPADGQVVVGGAGLSGIQVAGELAELRDDRAADPSIVLLEREETVAPAFEPAFQDAVGGALLERGIDVRTGVAVERADGTAVRTSQGVIPYDQFVWTGGIRGPDALDGDRPAVRATLRLSERTFGLGDAVRVVDADGAPVQATAAAAIDQAETAATNIERLVAYRRDGGDGFEPRLQRYRQSRQIRVVTVGDATVATVGSRVLQGTPAKALKTAVGARHLGTVGEVRDALGYLSQELG